ncbi:MAG: ABC transporter ATP-binding protein [Sphaerochaeta sp.]
MNRNIKNNNKKLEKGTLRILLSNLGKYKTPSILCPIFTACESLMEIMIPFVIAYLIDLGIEEGNMANVYKYGLIMAAMALFSLFCGYMAGRTTAEASSGFAANLREAMYKKIQTYSFANIDKFSTAGLVTRMTTDVTNVQNAYQMVLRIASKTPCMLFLSLIMCFRISPSLSMVFLVAVVFLAICLSIIMVNAGKYYKKTFVKYDKLNESIEENINGIKVVKAFVREDYEKEKFNLSAKILRKLYEKAESFGAIQSPVMMTSIYGCIIGLSWFGAKATYNGSITTGNLTSLFSYIMLILISIMMFSMVFIMITMAVTSAQRIVEVLVEEQTITNPENPITDIQNGQIDFNNVTFKYGKNAEEAALKHVDIHIKSGETIGIIGATGSGKSTFVSLLSRIYDVTEGSVEIGGIDVRKYDLTSLRDAVSVVLQKNVLFSGTIMSNLRWGKEDATLEECMEACKMACADEFIEKKHDKYLEKVEQGGSNFSGGQKQRLCIARALLKSPKVLVLDDSTSAVDTATDSMIQQAFRAKIPNTTKLIISQRISSVENTDRIIVMDNSNIVGFDTHENLLKNNEVYKEIFDTQTKGVGDFDELMA